ncbi:hypothetical protein ABZ814_13585 [Micromonospora musae]|uniref:hypothetical protein n=1 Tax=Micromonospora musae TaxID=1894970 RepID=UPI0033D3EEDA
MEFVLIWCFVFAYMAQRGAEGLVHAVKGTPNPRYEMKKQRARAAGQAPKQEPRYGGKEWWADLYSDALAANTEKRRSKAKAKAQPIDDMVSLTQEPKQHPHDPNNTRNCPTCKGSVVVDGRPCPRCLARQQERNADWEDAQRINAEWEAERRREAEWRRDMKPIGDDPRPTCLRCGETEAQTGSVFCLPCDVARGYYSDQKPTEEKPVPAPEFDHDSPSLRHLRGEWCGDPNCDCACKQCLTPLKEEGRNLCDDCLRKPTPSTETTARIYQFPNVKQIEKEIDMSNPEATGLPTAIAFAEAAANAHSNFSTAGSEGYAAALENMEFGPGIVGLAGQAREASAIAAEKWTALRDAMQDFMGGREFYQNNPDAPAKAALVNE